MSNTGREPVTPAPSRDRPEGRVLAIDLGQKRVGLAVSDELRLTARALPCVQRSSWKELLRVILEHVGSFDVREVVIGLPLSLDGTESEAAAEARRVARNLALSTRLPVRLQDERLTSKAAEERLRGEGFSEREVKDRVDGEAARLILLDYLSRHQTDEQQTGERHQ